MFDHSAAAADATMPLLHPSKAWRAASLVLTLAALAASTVPLPSSCSHTKPIPPISKNEARAMLGFAYSAYCPAMEVKNWTCHWCRKLAPDRLERIRVLYEPISRMRYLVALRHEDALSGTQHWVISFRGTVGDGDKLTLYRNIFFARNSTLAPLRMSSAFPSADAPPPTAHGGFYAQWNLARPNLLQALKELGAVPQRDHLYLTGHSSGAALSVMAAFDLVASPEIPLESRWEASRVSIFNFGMPPVGGPAFASAYERIGLGRRTWRLVHEAEEVPHIRFGSGFVHVGREIWERADGTWILCGAASPATGSARNCQITPPWTQDESCSASVPRERLTHDDHHYYLLEDAMAGEPFGCTQ